MSKSVSRNPPSSPNNFINGLLANTKVFGKLAQRNAACGIKFSDSPGFFVGQLCSLATSRVFSWGDGLHVAWADTRTHAAKMVYLQTLGNGAVLGFVVHAVRLPLRASSGYSIPFGVYIELPNPARRSVAMIFCKIPGTSLKASPSIISLVALQIPIRLPFHQASLRAVLFVEVGLEATAAVTIAVGNIARILVHRSSNLRCRAPGGSHLAGAFCCSNYTKRGV